MGGAPEINKTEAYFFSTDGLHRIHYVTYCPVGTVKGVVQLTHGMCDHIGRYDGFALFLAKNGYAVYGHDHLGHGGSVTEPEDFGYFGEQSGWRYLVDDLYEVTKIIQREYPNQPIFLFGHSMGSFVSRLYLSRYGEELSGLILSGTCGKLPAVGAGLSVIKLWIKTRGKRYRSKTLKKMIFGDYNKRLTSPRTPNDWVSRDPAVVDAYNKDPLNTFIFTAVGFRDLLTMMKQISQPHWYESVPKTVPIFLVSGRMDPVGNYGRGIIEVHGRLLDAGVDEVQIKLYPEGRHEMLNELNREEVYADLLAWLDPKTER